MNMKINNVLTYVIGIVGILMIGMGIGYGLGTYKINNCKTMSSSEAFKDKECREFYLGNWE